MRPLRHLVAACALAIMLALSPLTAHAETSKEVRAEVAKAQAELEGLAAEISEGEQRVKELQAQVDSLAEESILLQTRLLEDRDRLSEMVEAGYKEYSTSHLLGIILSSQTMEEFVSRLYYVQKVSDWQADCIEQLNDDRTSLERQMTQVSDAKEKQVALIAELTSKEAELDQLIIELNEKADRLQAEEEEAARKAAEEAARKAEEERRAREAEELARQQALAAAQAAGDVKATPTQGGSGWITCIASAYTIADNDPPGSTATASGIPLDESVPTVAMPMSMNPSRFYGCKIEISYNGMSVIATVTDCGYMGGGSRGLDLTPAVFRAFGFSTADAWGLREVSYRFL